MGYVNEPNYRRWTSWDVIKWKYLPSFFGGDTTCLLRYKDSWVTYNKQNIKSIALSYSIPDILLAGIAWIEVGGDPYFIDKVAYSMRSFDWSGPRWTDDNLSITKNPLKTSFGTVSIQLRVAAETLGLDPNNLSEDIQRKLIHSLENDVTNLAIVAKHLRNLIKHDFKNLWNTRSLTDEQIIIIGARYNRGSGLSMNILQHDLSYGQFIIKNKDKFNQLLR